MTSQRNRIGLILMGCALVVAASSFRLAELPIAEAADKKQAAAPKPWDADKLKQRLDAGEKIYLLDVRRPEELEENGALEGYVNIPIDELEGRLSEVPKDRPIVTYCQRARRAGRAAELLREHGYTEPIEVGGILEWKDKGHPVIYPNAAGATETKGKER